MLAHQRFHRLRFLHRHMLVGVGDAPSLLAAAAKSTAATFCLREYYQANALISTHRANIAALSVASRISVGTFGGMTKGTHAVTARHSCGSSDLIFEITRTDLDYLVACQSQIST
jgi:hypothetical protein